MLVSANYIIIIVLYNNSCFKKREKMSLINNYQEKWESRSSIRTRPRKIIDFNTTGNFFPQDKQVLLVLPEVQALGEQIKSEILLQSFYKYLNDIINLEIKLISSACNKIIYDDLVVKYSDVDKLNTHTIIIDEYYHVYVAQDMLLQLNQHFNLLKEFNYPISDSYKAVMQINQRLDVKYQPMFEIIAVCIFETTLVRELVEFFDSRDVHPSIKYYVNDHMNDEAKHYGFFYNLLCHSWNSLPDDYQQHIGQHLADFVKLYLNISSEREFNLQLLEYYLQDKSVASSLIDQAYHGFDITIEIPIVKNVLNVLKNSGIIDSIYVKDHFIQNGLYL